MPLFYIHRRPFQKEILTNFTMDFINSYQAYLTSAAFPDCPKNIFVSHYGYYVDEDAIRNIFPDLAPHEREETVKYVIFSAGGQSFWGLFVACLSSMEGWFWDA